MHDEELSGLTRQDREDVRRLIDKARVDQSKRRRMQKTALISVYRKAGVEAFGRGLVDLGWRLMASGGTATALRNAGLAVLDVAEVIAGSLRRVVTSALDACEISVDPTKLEAALAECGRPILGHRVVTLSREVYAGILARAVEGDEAELARIGVPRIDLVYVDLYPLEQAIFSPKATRESVVEMTDVGGPTLLYAAAAKGGQITISRPDQCDMVLHLLRDESDDREELFARLRILTQLHVARYHLLSAAFHAGYHVSGFAEVERELDQGLLSRCYQAGIDALRRAD